jgi:hypothetical protein
MRQMCCAIVSSDFMDSEKWNDVIQTPTSARVNSITGEKLIRWIEHDGDGVPSWRGSVTVLSEEEISEKLKGPTADQGWE